MRTILITSFNSHISRNVLDAGVLDLLDKNKNSRIVLIVPHYKAEYFARRFRDKDIIVEGLLSDEVSKTSRLGYVFKKIGLFFLNTKTRRLKVGYKFYCERKLGFFLVQRILGWLSYFSTARKIVRFLDLRLSSKGSFVSLFEKYNPDLIFSTDVQNENDVALMQAAHLRGIRTIGMVRSWDNPTQSAFRFFPDKLLVGSIKLKKETIKWQRYPKEKIRVVGNPHYDRYLKGPTKTKKEFFTEFKLDDRRPLILFAPFGDKLVYFNDIEQYIMELLGTVDAQVLVRMPPHRKVTLINFKKPDNMVLDRPGLVFKENDFEDREILPEEEEKLINTLYYSDIVISGPSSILLDGVFFDKPTIAAHLCPSRRPFFETMYWFEFNHMQSLMKTGGVRYAVAPDEMFSAIKDYFRDTSLDSEGRACARARWFSHADGGSSERIVKELI